ncbi:hypothetical protein C0Q70_07922 [Pomacea canaliculata]|uniref:Uncharacterized protein n=1 Tax=Pomacea canaliculata TaxID=400727 RepID=A0A2T7PGD8_POMCA|nr:hypothetical protein C0Q70_07922 [Pomacea canaliculata]
MLTKSYARGEQWQCSVPTVPSPPPATMYQHHVSLLLSQWSGKRFGVRLFCTQHSRHISRHVAGEAKADSKRRRLCLVVYMAVSVGPLGRGGRPPWPSPPMPRPPVMSRRSRLRRQTRAGDGALLLPQLLVCLHGACFVRLVLVATIRCL